MLIYLGLTFVFVGLFVLCLVLSVFCVFCFELLLELTLAWVFVVALGLVWGWHGFFVGFNLILFYCLLF